MQKIILSFVTIFAIILGAMLFWDKEKVNLEQVFSGEEEAVGAVEANALVAGEQKAGSELVVSEASLLRPGFIVAMKLEDNVPRGIVGASRFLNSGVVKQTQIILDEAALPGESIRFIVYVDDGNKKFSSSRDIPALSISGAPVFSDIKLY